MAKGEKMTIDEIQALLDSDDEIEITILPNGEVVESKSKKPTTKILTFREKLGGEYGA
jgi:hypothetical protein